MGARGFFGYSIEEQDAGHDAMLDAWNERQAKMARCKHQWEAVCPDAGGVFMSCTECGDVRPIEPEDCED